MKKFALIAGVILLFAANTSYAQNKAQKLIQSTVENIRSHKNAEMDFSYSYNDAFTDVIVTFQGKAWLQGESYKVVTDEQQTISNGTTIWTYLVEDQEVMMSDASDGTDNTPIKLITTLDKDYTATFTSSVSGQSIIKLSNPNGQYKHIDVRIDDKTKELKGLTVYADDDSSLSITITEWKFDQELKDDFFTFDEKAYPEVEIIDMR